MAKNKNAAPHTKGDSHVIAGSDEGGRAAQSRPAADGSAQADAAPHAEGDRQKPAGSGDNSDGAHKRSESHRALGSDESGRPPHTIIDSHVSHGRSAAISAIREESRRRRFLIKLANKQLNAAAAYLRSALGWSRQAPKAEQEAIKKRAGAILKRLIADKTIDADIDVLRMVGDELMVVKVSVGMVNDRRAAVEKEMKARARTFPVFQFAKGVLGFGDLALAVIVGEAGDLANYPNFRMLWKRLGLAPYEGRAMSSWKAGELTADEWRAAGYVARRRAELHAFIDEAMFYHQREGAEKSGLEFGLAKGPYGEVYIKRREATKLSHPDWTKLHADNDARRIMTKALVKDLWQAWGRPSGFLNARGKVAGPEIPDRPINKLNATARVSDQDQGRPNEQLNASVGVAGPDNSRPTSWEFA
jgi:hypothetical protein